MLIVFILFVLVKRISCPPIFSYICSLHLKKDSSFIKIIIIIIIIIITIIPIYCPNVNIFLLFGDVELGCIYAGELLEVF